MPPDDSGCQHGHDNEYVDPMIESLTAGRFYGRYYQRRHGQTRSDSEVVDDYSEQLRDKTTVGCWRMSVCRPRPGQCYMLPRQGGKKEEQETSCGESSEEYLEGKQQRGDAKRKAEDF